MRQTIEISSLTIIKIVLVILLLVFLYFVREIILLLFIVAVIVAALEPLVENMQSRKIPRLLAVIFIYLILTLLFSSLIYLVVPPLVIQIRDLAVSLPDYFNRYQDFIRNWDTESLWSWQNWLSNASSQLSKISSGFFSAASTILGGLVSVATILVLSFYLLLEEQGLKHALINVLPLDRKEAIIETIRKIGRKIGNWLRGQLALCFVIGVFDFFILLFVGVPYALTIAILAAFLEIIPLIGPILTAILAVVLTLTTVGWLKAILVLIAFIIVQQIENQILVPKIMQRAVGLSPVLIIVALLIGGKLFGILGVILAVPVAASIAVVIQEWPKLISKF